MSNNRDQNLTSINIPENDSFSMISFPPDGVDINDIHENGSFFTDEETAWLIKYFSDPNKIKEGKYSKHIEKPNNVGKELPGSVIYVEEEGNKNKRILGVYEDKQGEGSYGSVSYTLDPKTKKWEILKTIPKEKKKPTSKKRNQKNSTDSTEGEVFDNSGCFVRHDSAKGTEENNGFTAEDYTGEYYILSKLALAGGSFERESPSKQAEQKCIIMELAKGKPLSDLEEVSPEQFIEITVNLLKAFQNLIEDNEILHRDIKDENIMYDKRTGEITIIDYGLSARYTKPANSVHDIPVGTRAWTAPEIQQFLEIDTIYKLLNEMNTHLEKEVNYRDTITILKTLNNKASYDISDILKLNELLEKYSSELKESQTSNINKSSKLKSVINGKRIRKKIKILNEYKKELKKDKKTNRGKIDLIKEAIKQPELYKLDSLLNEYMIQLEQRSAKNETTVERIAKCVEASKEIHPISDVLTHEYHQLAQEYSDDLAKKHYETVTEIYSCQYSIIEINKLTESTIEDFSALLKDSTTKKYDPKAVKRKDIETFNDDVKLYLSYLSKLNSTNLEQSESENISRGLTAIKENIKNLLASLEVESERKFTEQRKLVPSLNQGKIEYTEKTEIYSLALVIQTLLSKTKNQKFIEEIVTEFFDTNVWSSPTTRPTINEALTFFTPRLPNKKQMDNKDTEVNHDKNIAIIDCSLLLDGSKILSEMMLNNCISGLQNKKPDEVILLGKKGTTFRHYVAIRNAIECKNIKVRQEVLRVKHDASSLEIVDYLKTTYENQCSQRILVLKNKIDQLQSEKSRLAKEETRRLDELNKEVKENEKKIERYESRPAEIENEIIKRSARIKMLAEIITFCKEIASLENEIVSSEEELDNTKSENTTEKESEIDRLTKLVLNYFTSNDNEHMERDLELINTETMDQVALLKEKSIKRHETAIIKLQQVDTKKTIELYQQRIVRTQKEIESLNDAVELKKINSKIETLENELAEINKQKNHFMRDFLEPLPLIQVSSNLAGSEGTLTQVEPVISSIPVERPSKRRHHKQKHRSKTDDHSHKPKKSITDNTINHLSLITQLKNKIESFSKDIKNKENPNHVAFCLSLDKLWNDLNDDIEKQTGRHVKAKKSTAEHIAEQTLTMLDNLNKKGSGKEEKLKDLITYENECKKTSGWNKFGKTLAMVCFAAVGFIASVAIGAAIGLAVGAWSGPGAFVTAAIGAITGGVAFTAAMAGVTAGAAAGTLGALALSGVLLFKPRGLRKEAGDVAKLAKRFVDPEGYILKSKRFRQG